MKFKSIFILFNTIIILFLVFVLILPYFLLGEDFFYSFWDNGWPLMALLGVVWVSVDIFYLVNRQLFRLLEREDWPALVQFLERKVLQDGKYTHRYVKLLINSYLVLADPVSVMTLEKKLAFKKPALIHAEALVFGSARILMKDNAGAVEFFSLRLNTPGTKSSEWISWYYGFALLPNSDFEKAADQFALLIKEGRTSIITGLSAYFLGTTLAKNIPSQRESLLLTAENGRKQVKSSFKSMKNWKKDVVKVQSEVYAAILAKYINETTQWVFNGEKI